MEEKEDQEKKIKMLFRFYKENKINVEVEHKSAFNEAYERKMGEFKAGCTIAIIKILIVIIIIMFLLIIASF